MTLRYFPLTSKDTLKGAFRTAAKSSATAAVIMISAASWKEMAGMPTTAGPGTGIARWISTKDVTAGKLCCIARQKMPGTSAAGITSSAHWNSFRKKYWRCFELLRGLREKTGKIPA